MGLVPAVAGVGLDQLVGEPPLKWHPVARYGALMTGVEQRLYHDSRLAGAAFAVVGVGLGVTCGVCLGKVFGARTATVIATAVCSAGKMLDSEASAVFQLLASDDLVGARQRLRSLVGRTTDELSEPEISRAVIESVAENSVDAVTASMFWAAVAGPPGVLAHRAINTLDAMVGHHNDRHERFGWASARLDDVANYLPARLGAASVALARPDMAQTIWRVVRRDARQHPSPNGGVIEAAYAAALNITLGGVNQYGGEVEDRGALGEGPPAMSVDVAQAIRLRRHSTVAVAVLLCVPRLLRVMYRARVVGSAPKASL
jgi:adenosylcobinamide-phosphate synthase